MKIRVINKIIFEERNKWFYSKHLGLVTMIFAELRGESVLEENHKFQEYQVVAFDYEYDFNTSYEDFLYYIYHQIGFKNDEDSWITEFPIYFYHNKIWFKPFDYSCKMHSFIETWDIASLNTYVVCNRDAGTLGNIDGVKYIIHSRESGKHSEPHVHVQYGDIEDVFSIMTGERLSKNKARMMPIRIQEAIKTKIICNREELLQYWNNKTDGIKADVSWISSERIIYDFDSYRLS